MLALPGGHLEMYESFARCAQRELEEETLLSVKLEALRICGTYNVIRKEKNYHYITIYMV
jgi:8-oxo-dGTP diphosphatase